MAGRFPPLAVLLFLLLAVVVAHLASAVCLVFDAHRSTSAELFVASPDESLGDLERMYEAVRTFQILGVEKDKSLTGKACKLAAKKLASPSSSSANDLFHAVRISGVFGCSVDAGVYDDVVVRLKAVIKDTNSLLKFYYSLGGLLSITFWNKAIVLFYLMLIAHFTQLRHLAKAMGDGVMTLTVLNLAHLPLVIVLTGQSKP